MKDRDNPQRTEAQKMPSPPLWYSGAKCIGVRLSPHVPLFGFPVDFLRGAGQKVPWFDVLPDMAMPAEEGLLW